MNLDFGQMTTPTLVVRGEDVLSPEMTVRGADWHADPYQQSPGADAMNTLVGGKHFMGA